LLRGDGPRTGNQDGQQRALGAASAAVARFEPAAAARERQLTLLDLSADVLGKVAASLDPDDELAASLACRKLRDALRGVLRSSARPARALTTRVRSLLGSLGKPQWGVACAGTGPDAGEWYKEHEYTDGPCAMAAAGGHLSVLRWLHASGCPPWDEEAYESAAKGGHLSALQWLRANGCPP
jgi:hypothetical protein